MSSQSAEGIGKVKTLWRYAVKSMNGEVVNEAFITEGGVLGDRAYALIDRSTGKIASAKMPKKWGDLLGFSACFVEPPHLDAPAPPVRIEWPDGTHVVSNHGDLDAMLSKTLGREVSLTTTRPDSVSVERLDPLDAEESILDIGGLMLQGRFADYAPLHLLTTATLAHLSALRSEVPFDVRRFRPNLLIETTDGQNGFIENEWVGKTVAIGDQVRLQVSDPTPRCAVPTLAQKGLTKDPKVLRTIAEHNRQPVPLLDNALLPCTGVYGFILQGGIVGKGDPVRVE